VVKHVLLTRLDFRQNEVFTVYLYLSLILIGNCLLGVLILEKAYLKKSAITCNRIYLGGGDRGQC
jgi:hypothetical protein